MESYLVSLNKSYIEPLNSPTRNVRVGNKLATNFMEFGSLIFGYSQSYVSFHCHFLFHLQGIYHKLERMFSNKIKLRGQEESTKWLVPRIGDSPLMKGQFRFPIQEKI